MSTISTDDDAEIYYEIEGPKTAPTVVFLNGMTQSTEHWSSQVNRFRDDFRVLRYDARGQGRSEFGDAPPTMGRHVDDLTRLLDAVDATTVSPVGFSHGARIALGFAANRPERVEKLVLCSLGLDPGARVRTIVESWRRILDEGGLEAMSWAALPTILGDAYLEANEHILDGIVQATVRRNTERGVRALLEAMGDYPDLGELASAVEAPTLVLSAPEDLLVDADGARKLAQRTGGRHVEIAEVGHTIPIEAPDRFHDHITSFLVENG